MATPSDGGGQTLSNRNITSDFSHNSTSNSPSHSPRPSSPCIPGGRPQFPSNSDGPHLAFQNQQQATWKHPTPDKVPPHSPSYAKLLESRPASSWKTTSFSNQHQLPPDSTSSYQQSAAQSCEMSTLNQKDKFYL